MMVAFLIWERRAREPMLPIEFFRSRSFSAGNAAIFFTFASLFSAVFFLPQLLQVGLGDGPLQAGLRLMPWTATFITVAPDGRVLPCPAASVIPGLCPPSATEHPLRWIWYESPAFNRFRGFGWMSDPCRSCPRRFEDFGGCRCQAYLLAGDPSVTDPVCTYSPHRHLVTEALGRGDGDPGAPVYRKEPVEGRSNRGVEQRSSRGGK